MIGDGKTLPFPRFSACLEMLFVKESSTFADRIRMAHAAGFDAIEFWRWTDKDMPAIREALAETGVSVAGIVAEPMIPLTDDNNHIAFLDGLAKTLDTARSLGAPILIAQAGDLLADVERARQRDNIIDCLVRSAGILRGSGVALALEPLNTLVDHPGYFLSSTEEGLDIVDAVARPEIGLLYDLYHSMVMGEVPETVLAGRVDRIVHAHIADHPGRNEPGSGQLPLRQAMDWLDANGFRGRFGLEFRPTRSTSDALLAVTAELA
jgi:hydroxypyruvate isomerase